MLTISHTDHGRTIRELPIEGGHVAYLDPDLGVGLLIEPPAGAAATDGSDWNHAIERLRHFGWSLLPVDFDEWLSDDGDLKRYGTQPSGRQAYYLSDRWPTLADDFDQLFNPFAETVSEWVGIEPISAAA